MTSGRRLVRFFSKNYVYYWFMFNGRLLYFFCFIFVANLGIVDIYLAYFLPRTIMAGTTDGKTIVGLRTRGKR